MLSPDADNTTTTDTATTATIPHLARALHDRALVDASTLLASASLRLDRTCPLVHVLGETAAVRLRRQLLRVVRIDVCGVFSCVLVFLFLSFVFCHVFSPSHYE